MAKKNTGTGIKRRFLKIAVVFFKILLDFTREYKIIRKHGYAHALKKMEKRHEKRAQQLYDCSIELGGVLIKLCQFFSSRRDFFPESYIRILSALQDNVPAVPFEEIESVLKEEYGDYRSIYKEIQETPEASASLGQVHRAVLKNGTAVVLKIMKPEVERVIDTDFAILDSVFKLLSHFKVFKERADVLNVLNEFIKVTGDELNFKREIYIAGKFRDHFRKYDFVTIPTVYEEYSTPRIIVMDYHRGDKVSDIHLWKSRNNDPLVISRRIIEIYLDQLINFGIVHFDPHPGNILVTSDNSFILIDFGMSGIITEKMRKGLLEALKAFIARDYRTILDILFELGFIRKGINRYSLLNVTEYLFSEILEVIQFDRESLQSIDFSPIKDDLVELLYLQPFNIPFEWAFISKTIGIISGLTTTLNPGFNVYDELKPYADKYIRKNLYSMTRESLDRMKLNFDLLVRFPARIDYFLGNIERGNFRFKVDYTEMMEKIDEVKTFVIRILSFIVCLAALISSYVFWNSHQQAVSRLFLVLSGLSALFLLLYRTRTLKDKMNRYF